MNAGLALLLGVLAAVQDPGRDVARDALEAVAAGDEELLRALAREFPHHVRPLVHELLWEALRAGKDDLRALNAARALAAAAAEVGDGEDLAATVSALERLDEDARAAAAVFERAFAAGSQDLERGECAAAREASRAAVEAALEIPMPYLELRARRLHAETLGRTGDRAEQHAEMLQVLELERRLRLDVEESADLEALARSEAEEGNLLDAAAHLERAEQLARATGEPARANALLAQRGAALASLGHHAAAHEVLTRALASCEGLSMRAQVLILLGGLAGASGHYGTALARTSEAVRAARQAADPLVELRATIQLALVDSEMGLASDARHALASAHELLERPELEPERGGVLLARGLIELDAGRFEAGLDVLEEALRAVRSDFERAEVERHRGTACLALLGDRTSEEASLAREAARAFQRSLELSSADPLRNAWCRSALGDALLAQGLTDDAQRAYERALQDVAGVASLEGTWRARSGLGRVAEVRGRDEEALAHYLAAIEEIESLRAELVAPDLRLRWLGNKLEPYRLAARLQARAGRIADAFRTAEAAKARVLLELCARREREEVPIDVPPRLAARERLDEAESRLRLAGRALTDLPLTPLSAATRADLEERLRQARAAHEAARIELELADPRVAVLLGLGEAPSLERAQAALRDGDLLLEYMVGPEGASLFAIHRHGARFVELDTDEADLARRIELVLRPFELLRSGRIDLVNLGFDAENARALHELLLGPVRDELAACHTLWIVPDGPLRRLPFGLLVAAREKRAVDPGRLFAHYAGCLFLVEERALALLPTAGLLEVARPSGASELDLLVVADPLPLPSGEVELARARDEARAVAGERPGPRVQVLLGEEANEGSVKALLPGARVAHFATHGVLDDERPAYSRLALAPGAEEDGWLCAWEIEELELAAERVFLSACDTLGEAGRGEGHLGLSRAFLVAGARSVVATSWAVDDDAASELVRRYGEALAAGEEPIDALRVAQVGILRGEGRPAVSFVHPWFWAGYQHVGGR